MNGPDDLSALERLFRLSPDAVVGVRRGTAVFANGAAARLFGRDVTGQPVAGLLPGLALDPAEGPLAAAVTAAGKPCFLTAGRWENVLVLTLRPESAAAAPLVPPAALSQLRTAAASLRLSLDRLIGPEADDPGAAAAYRSYFSLLRALERLSDSSALAAEDLYCRMAPVDLGRLVAELTESVAAFVREKEITLACRVPDSPCVVMADRDRVEQLVLILLSNSLKYTPAGGRITLSLRPSDRQAVLTLDDSGRGFSDEELSAAFTVDADPAPADVLRGAGLGLYVAQGIARLHGGALMLRSREGQGARVSVSFPVKDTLSLRDAEPPAPAGPHRILTELADILPAEFYLPRYFD